MQRPLDLTIVISNYNTRGLLRSCIESIYRHTRDVGFEIICIDDASSDGSADMVAENFPDVILLRNSVNQSYARNQNAGLRLSRGRYACLLDSDTLLIGNAFQSLVKFMDDHPEAAVCGPKLLNPDGSIQHHIRGFVGLGTFCLQTLSWHRLFPNSPLMNRYYNTQFDYSRPQRVESIGTTVYVIRRSTWEDAGMLDERFRWAMPDLAYNYMLHQKNYKVYYTPSAAVVHFSGQTASQDPLRTLREQCRGLIDFNDAYHYFGKSSISKSVVRLGVRFRYCLKVLEYYLSSDKRVIKGPGAPKKEVAERAALIIGARTTAIASRSSCAAPLAQADPDPDTVVRQ